MLQWQGAEAVSVIMLDKNNYSCCAVEHIVEQSLGKGTIKTLRSSEELFGALSFYEHTDTVIASYDVIHSNNFILLDILVSCFPHIKIIVVIYNATAAVVTMLKSLGVKIMLSYHDSHVNFITALKCYRRGRYLSPVISKIIRGAELECHRDSRVNLLTPMEKFVLGNLLTGTSPREIAETKMIHVKTVSSHKTSALRKMSIKKMSELVLTC